MLIYTLPAFPESDFFAGPPESLTRTGPFCGVVWQKKLTVTPGCMSLSDRRAANQDETLVRRPRPNSRAALAAAAPGRYALRFVGEIG